jgi:hypothetical protein
MNLLTWEFLEIMDHPVQPIVCTSCTVLVSEKYIKERATASWHLNTLFASRGEHTISEIDKRSVVSDTCLLQKSNFIV